MPLSTPPDVVEREYRRNLLKYQKAYEQLMRDGLKELLPSLMEVAQDELPDSLRMDSESWGKNGKYFVNHWLKSGIDSFTESRHSVKNVTHMDANIEHGIRALFESVQLRLMKLFPDSLLRKWVQAMTAHANTHAKKNLGKVGKVLDVDIEPLLKDGELNPFFNNVVDENIGLIRSIPQAKMAQFKNKLVDAISRDLPRKHIQKIIQNNFDVTKQQAQVLARDQVGKLNGKLDQYRQQQIGGKRYVWDTAGDERVRGRPGGKYPDAKPSHWKLDGKTFSWDKPPVAGTRGERCHPGQAIQCRCTARMVLEDILDT